MKSITLFTSLLTLLFPLFCEAGGGPNFQDEQVRLSYSIGYQIGGDFLRQGQELNPEFVLEGIKAALGESEALMDQSLMKKSLVELGKDQARKELEQSGNASERP